MDWKKDRGPWDFKKSYADVRYNEGTHIATNKDPVWQMPEKGKAISDHHAPCGYWLKDYVGPEKRTSDLYPIEDYAYIEDPGCEIIDGRLVYQPQDSGSVDSSGANILSGTLVLDFVLIEYKDWPIENVDSSSCSIIAGNLVQDFFLREYSISLEEVDSSGATILSGLLDDRLIKYTDWPVEKITSSSATILEGVLE